METETQNDASVGATEKDMLDAAQLVDDAIEQTFVEVDYRCSRQKCGHTQTVRFFSPEECLPVTCCVHCRAGFGMELMQMIQNHVGMFPISNRIVDR